MRYPLELAERIAQALVEKLAPHAERIAIAGSIRRRRPDVGDIDLVAIPKLEQVTTGLFSTETQRPRDSRLAVEFCGLLGKIECRGDSIIRGEVPLTNAFHLRERGLGELVGVSTTPANIGVDLYLCTPETWATTLLIRTGSAAHNIWLCSRARELGGKLHAGGEGLELPGQYDAVAQRTVNMRRIVPVDEQEIFAALDLNSLLRHPGPAGKLWIVPEARELAHGHPIWMDLQVELK